MALGGVIWQADLMVPSITAHRLTELPAVRPGGCCVPSNDRLRTRAQRPYPIHPPVGGSLSTNALLPCFILIAVTVRRYDCPLSGGRSGNDSQQSLSVVSRDFGIVKPEVGLDVGESFSQFVVLRL